MEHVGKLGAAARRRELVYCPICTHTVEGEVVNGRKGRLVVKPGQRCGHCHSPLDAGVVFLRDRAA